MTKRPAPPPPPKEEKPSAEEQRRQLEKLQRQGKVDKDVNTKG